MNLPSRALNRAYRTLYWPVCRAYARHFIGDKPADSVMLFLYSLHFFKVRGYWPNLKSPRSFEGKLARRMLFDRNPLWTMLSDKIHMRNYVAEKVGTDYLIPLLWTGDNPEEIPFDKLPQKFVLKTNHGCGYNIIVKDKGQLDRTKAKKQLKKWLGTNYCESSLLGTAWGYRNIKPMIMVEELLEDNGNIPSDYKFFCFSGRAEFIQVSFDRFGDASERILTREFNPLDLYNGVKLYEKKVERPKNYEEMVHVAESLSQGLDFIRVDLYNVGGQIYFGELTCYPAGGLARFTPRKWDFVFGEKWNMAP